MVIKKPTELTMLLFFIYGLFLGGLLVFVTDKDNATVLDRPNGKIVVWNDKSYALISVKSAVDRAKELKNIEDWELAVSTK